jgi:hypothetical protein
VSSSPFLPPPVVAYSVSSIELRSGLSRRLYKWHQFIRKAARPSSRAAFVRHKGEKSGEEHYEEAAGRNAYSVARCASAYHGCMLEASRALNAARSDKAAAYDLAASDVLAALRAQNLQVSAGILNQPPTPSDEAYQINRKIGSRAWPPHGRRNNCTPHWPGGYSPSSLNPRCLINMHIPLCRRIYSYCQPRRSSG